MSLIQETSITLYNKFRDKSTGKEAYTKTLIKNASWHGQITATISTNTKEASRGAINMASSIDIRIPIYNNDFGGGKTYIEPKKWNKLADADRDKYFTIQEDDRAVKGNCDYVFSATNPIANLDNGYDDVVNVTVTKINDFGSKFLQDYRIGGK